MVETVIEASRVSVPGIFTPACREGSVARLTSVRNDAIEWNAIVVIVSMVRIVAFRGGA
jgi:peroxiredoxin